MILIDIDNLNILVLFILAFISFKGYQHDAQVFDSETEEEISQNEEFSLKDKDEEVNDEGQAVSSQVDGNVEQKTKMVREEKNSDETIQVQFQLQGGKSENPTNSVESPITEQKVEVQVEAEDQVQKEDQDEQEKIEIEEAIENQQFDSYSNENPSAQDQDFDSIDSSYSPDGQDEEDGDNPECPKKMKRIRKQARKLKRNLRRQQEFMKKVAEKVQRALGGQMQESLEAS